MIICIEGVDGCGKHTQSEKLYQFLQNKGYKCLLLSFPNYESQGSAPVKMYLSGEFIGEKLNPYQINSLFAVDRLTTLSKIDLSEYDFVIFDRYVPSSMIYQSYPFESDNQVDQFVEWVEMFEYDKLQLPKPDKVVFLDMPIEMSLMLSKQRNELKGGMKRDIHEENDELLIHAYNRAKYLANKQQWTIVNCGSVNLKSVEEIHKEILTKLGFEC